VANSWERIRLRILKLPLEQMNDLHAWLGEAIALQQAETESLGIPVLAGREIVESRQIEKVTYRLEQVRCGKSACRCATGKLHGPYWYAYQKQSGKLKSWYIGKNLSTPDE
jgi:hypothetical protein